MPTYFCEDTITGTRQQADNPNTCTCGMCVANLFRAVFSDAQSMGDGEIHARYRVLGITDHPDGMNAVTRCGAHFTGTPPTFMYAGYPTATYAGEDVTIYTSSHSPAADWPDLPDAPYSTVGALARQWLKNGDWTAVPKLLDALQDANRPDDWREIKKAVATYAVVRFAPRMDVLPWKSMALSVLWFDLFDIESTVAKLQEGKA